MSSVMRPTRLEKVAPAEDTASIAERNDALLGRVLLDAGKLTEFDVNRIAVRQRKENLRFGEAARRLGLVSSDDLAQVLAKEFRYPYVTGESPLDPTLSAAHRPFGAAAEALRELRSQLRLRWFDGKRNTLAIVAARKRSGCSHLAANLAIVFAQLGERTLLLDANFRRPSQEALFGVPPGLGLSDFLAGRCALGEVLTSVAPFDDLQVVCAGTPPPNPQELLSRMTFQYLVETAGANFGAVIIDTPPILEFADAQIIATAAGGCLLATRRHRTRVADVERAKTKFEPTRAVLLGTALVG